MLGGHSTSAWRGAAGSEEPAGPVPPHGWRGMPPAARYWLPVLVSAIIQIPAALWSLRGTFAPPWAAPASDTPGWSAALTILLAVLGPIALLFARRFPGPVVLVSAAFGALDLMFGSGGAPYVALAFAIVGAVVRGARIWAWISVSAAWIVTVTFAIVFNLGHLTPVRVAVPTLGILLVFGVGEGMRARREAAAEFVRRDRERRAREVQQERVRIARELHDVLAHSLSQITVQAGVGLHLMDKQPDQAAHALREIRETSKSALDEVRHVLGVLRAEGGADPAAPLRPEPDLARLPELVAGFAANGLEVQLDDELSRGAPPSPAVQLALYRIAQEALTNVARHSDAAHASLRLWREAGALRLEVRDTGRPREAPEAIGGGRGIMGMRERAELLGGTIEVGPAASGGFRVAVQIPEVGSA
ncbi:MAG: sensor histidine kinase [Actinomycetales bacterium]|nr:sensor histidine kinase [Actinomycetales bacterium]